MVVEPDDNILFDKFAGTVIVVDDEELLLLNEYDVIGIITKKYEN